MSDAPYVPQRFDIIAVTLSGTRLPDGTIKLFHGTTLPEWPKAVSHNGVVVGLTRVEDKGPVRTGGIIQHAVYEDGLDDA